jgi:glycosyltransferase involved in cell wall biosynthesis
MVNAPNSAITPLLLTYDEAPNIDRTLSHLRWAARVLVVDSNSTDETVTIASRFPNVEIIQRTFDTHTNQWNYGLDRVDSSWTLALDADYTVPPATAAEMAQRVLESDADGFYAPLTYCVRGRVVHHAVLPPRLVLFRTSAGRFYQDGHTQRLGLRGKASTLSGNILHDDRKSLRRWLWAQDGYAELEVEKLLATPMAKLPLQDQIRKALVIAPWLVPTYYLLGRGGIRDGWAGIDYAAQRAVAELVLSIKLIERTFLGGP